MSLDDLLPMSSDHTLSDPFRSPPFALLTPCHGEARQSEDGTFTSGGVVPGMGSGHGVRLVPGMGSVTGMGSDCELFD